VTPDHAKRTSESDFDSDWHAVMRRRFLREGDSLAEQHSSYQKAANIRSVVRCQKTQRLRQWVVSDWQTGALPRLVFAEQAQLAPRPNKALNYCRVSGGALADGNGN
jgi:hypothetical protein